MPPRAQRLYPRMRERPPEFRVNPAWPFWNDLLFFVAPGHTPHTWLRSYGPEELDWDVREVAPTDHLYDPTIRRFCIYAYRGSTPTTIQCRLTRTFISPTTPYSMLFFVNYVVKEAHILIQLPVVGHTASLETNVDYISDGSVYTGFGWGSSQWTPMRIPVDPRPYAYQWHALAYCYNGSGIVTTNFKFRLDGQHIGNPTSTGSYGAPPVVLSLCRHNLPNYAHYSFRGFYSDVLVLRTWLSDDTIKALSDFENVDLRIGGIPLILYPRRRLWPVAPVAEYVKRRQLGLRVGCREAVT